jgi:branched-chain amino acid aminotransferase
MPKLVWLNGVVVPLEEAVTSVADHAHLYGDGLFEGIRIYGGKIYKFEEHLDRLYHGIAYLAFEMRINKDELRTIILDVCRQAQIPDGYIRLNVTRGTGLGLDPKNIDKTPNVMVMVSTLNLYPPEMHEMGLSIVSSPIRVIPPDSLDPRVKCIGRYASNILAKHLANRAGAQEGLMLNHQGMIAEGTGNNIFLIQKGVIRTPHPSCGVLRGITRDSVIELARKAGYEVVEDFLTPQDIHMSEEAFFTGTATEVIAITSFDGIKVGCGTPGQVTQRIVALFQESTKTGTAF